MVRILTRLDSSGRLFTCAAAGWVAVVAAACATAAGRTASDDASPPATGTPAGIGRHTAADVAFMSDMIVHHAQAVLMAEWSPTHDASPDVRTISERVIVSQEDEIAFMESWLRERNEPVPETDSAHAMHGMDHALMPGMLTAEQIEQLDRASGREFDRLFLTFMIQHHEGALTMVEELFRAQGAAQDEDVFRFASDVNADQIAEIDRMSHLLATLSDGGM